MPAKRRINQTLTLFLVAVVSLVAPVTYAPRGAAAGAERVPVVLACEHAGGRDYWVRTGIIDMLQDEGWLEGRDLFVFEPGGKILDLSVVSRELAGYVREIAAACEVPEVDIVAAGVAGLYARYCIERLSTEPVRVRTLVTVGSPHRGAFFAGVLKSAVAMVRYERTLAQEMGLFDALVGRSPAASAADVQKILADTPWESESQFVLERGKLYEPLYHEYLMERHFAIPGLPLESWQETFAGWLERRYPQVWEARISGNQRETVTGLTTGYYELLSMEAAKNGYAFRIIPRRDLLDEGVLKVMDVSGPGDFLLNCALRILRSLVYNSLVFGKSALEEAILTAVSRRMSPVEGPEDPLLDRLVTESVMVNMGASASRRFFAVPANVYLGRWNRSSSNRPPGTRYVSIAGRRPGILRTLWPQLGPSDWFVEVDSAVAPQTPRDTVMVFDCRPATTALGVLGNPEAKRALVGILRDPGSSWCRVDLPEGKPVRVVLSSWRPTEIRLAGSADGGPGGRVLTLYAGRLPHGWRLAAEFADGTPCSLVSQDPGGPPGGFQGSDSPGAGEDRGKGFFEKVFVVDVSPHGDDCSETPSVVLKLVPADSAGEGFLDRVPELYDKEVCIEALVQACGYDSVSSDLTARSRQEEETGFEDSELVEWISPTPQGDEDPGDDAGRPPVAAEEESRAPGTGEVSGPAGGNPGEDNEDATDDVVPAGGTSGRDPLIVVTYRSKRTCHLVPAEEYPVPVTLELEGPKKWVTGKPAQFQVFFQAKPRSGVVVDEVRFQPGPRFSVLWRRSGEFTVSAGAKVSFRVITAEGEKRFTNVYVTEVPVSVLTPGITR